MIPGGSDLVGLNCFDIVDIVDFVYFVDRHTKYHLKSLQMNPGGSDLAGLQPEDLEAIDVLRLSTVVFSIILAFYFLLMVVKIIFTIGTKPDLSIYGFCF